eukprot:789921-Amphidinium_carterae.1
MDHTLPYEIAKDGDWEPRSRPRRDSATGRAAGAGEGVAQGDDVSPRNTDNVAAAALTRCAAEACRRARTKRISSSVYWWTVSDGGMGASTGS